MVGEIRKGQAVGQNEARSETVVVHEEMHSIETAANEIVYRLLLQAVDREMQKEEFQQKVNKSAAVLLKMALDTEVRSVLGTIRKMQG